MGIGTVLRALKDEKDGTFLLSKNKNGDLQLSVISSARGGETEQANSKQVIHVSVTANDDEYGLWYNGILYGNVEDLNEALHTVNDQCFLSHPYDPNDIRATAGLKQISLN